MYRKDSQEAKRIARNRIDSLFTQAAELAREGDTELSRRYVTLARRIGMKVDIPVGHRMDYCRKCNAYMLPSRTCRVRVNRGRKVIACLVCGNTARFPYRKSKNRR